MSDTQPEAPTEDAEDKQEHTFSQADVDRIVRERVKRERDKYADYDDLKAKASTAQTAEERIAELEQRYQQAETRALRSDIAAKYGIDAEDRDLFLTGTDEETLTAQAKRLADRESERMKRSNHVPDEGNTPATQPDDMRAFTRDLFSRAVAD